MSSRRDSAFSDSHLPHQYSSNNMLPQRANSDCIPTGIYPSNRHTQSMEQLNRIRSCEIVPQHHYSATCTNLSCHRPEQVSVFSNCGSNYEPMRSNHYYQKDAPPSINQCSQNYYHPDPGGGSISALNCITNQKHSNYSDAPNAYYTPHSHESDIPNIHNQRNNYQRIQDVPAPVQEKPRPRPVQLCSLRLQPTKHQNKNAIVSILDDGEVCVEFIKKKGHPKKEVVCEVMRISPDGERIILYEPEGRQTPSPGSEPPPLPSRGADQIYSIENLPEKHWKKYTYASKFVDVVKSKTPKITYYSDKAKCLLMENLTDFEANFYEGNSDALNQLFCANFKSFNSGGKATNSTTEGITITDSSGRKRNFHVRADGLSATFELMFNHMQECHNHCLLLESTLSQLPGSNFPIIVGRRPSNFANTSTGKENQSRAIIVSIFY